MEPRGAPLTPLLPLFEGVGVYFCYANLPEIRVLVPELVGGGRVGDVTQAMLAQSMLSPSGSH